MFCLSVRLFIVQVLIVAGRGLTFQGGKEAFLRATQTSTYEYLKAGNAIDGDLATRSHTKCDKPQEAVFYLKDGYNVLVTAIKLINGKTNYYVYRLGGVKIFVEDDIGTRFPCGTVKTRTGFTITDQTYVHTCRKAYGNKIVFVQPKAECLELREVFVSIKHLEGGVIRDVSMSSSFLSLSTPYHAVDGSRLEAHTECKGKQWIRATLKVNSHVNSVTVVNGKVNQYSFRLDGAKVYAESKTGDTLCGVIDVRPILDVGAQTYTVACSAVRADSVRLELDTDNCLSLSKLAVDATQDVPFNKDKLYQVKFLNAEITPKTEDSIAMNAIDNELTSAITACQDYSTVSVDFNGLTASIQKIVIVTGDPGRNNLGSSADVFMYSEMGEKKKKCGTINVSKAARYELYCEGRSVLWVEIVTKHRNVCLVVAEVQAWGYLFAGGNDTHPSALDIQEITPSGEALESDCDTTSLFDRTFSTGVTLHNDVPEFAKHKMYFSFSSNVVVNTVVLYVEGGSTLGEEVDVDVVVKADDVTTSDSISFDDYDEKLESKEYNCYTSAAHLLQLHTQVWELTFDCRGHEGYEVNIMIQGNTFYKFHILEARFYAESAYKTSEIDVEFGDAFSTPMFSTTPITATPYHSDDAEANDVLFSSVPQVFDASDSDSVVWTPQFKSEIPLKQIENSKSEVLGFLVEGGYVNYVLDDKDFEEKAKKKQEKKDNSQGKKGSGTSLKMGSSKKANDRRKVDKNALADSVTMLQRFNGFPETGKVSKDVISFMKGDRCGNHDIEFSPELRKEEESRCWTIIKNRIANWKLIDSIECGSLDNHQKSMCVLLPGRDVSSFVVAAGYYVDVDVFFKSSADTSWDVLSQNFAIYYNFDKTIGSNGYGDAIRLFGDDKSFGFQYQELSEGKPKMVRLPYKLSKVQLSMREFKIRVDVEEGGTAYLLIDNNDVGKLKYQYPLRSQALVKWHLKKPDIITARLCKRSQKPAVRKRRYAVSLHSWSTKNITFNFQNYSRSLGEEGTRQGVLKALNTISNTLNINFIEKNKHEAVMLSYMFIRGKHADGTSFDGPGRQKAHAYSPVHSEIHFNDWEDFSLKKNDRTTSIIFVALHETGHALGLKHSEYRQAVMNAGYNSDTAFDVNDLHRDDYNALKVQYPDSVGKKGDVKPLQKRSVLTGYEYTPKLPFPIECFRNIDAAVSNSRDVFLFSNSYVWQYQMPDLAIKSDARKISDVFPGWTFPINAAFKVSDRIFLTSEKYCIRYRYTYSGSQVRFFPEKGGTLQSLLVPSASKEVLPPIKSAFTLAKGRKVKSILVVNDKLWYEAVWKNYKNVQSLSKVEDPSGTKLIGKPFNKNEFNAAIPYERQKTDSVEVLKFDMKYLQSVTIFPAKKREKNPAQSIPTRFKIKGWCK